MRSSSRSGSFSVRSGLVVVVGLIALSGSPAAGQNLNASIVGQVTDQSGAVLPGVTVTATSPALQVPQVSITTNEVGEYRLSPLPIGQYSVLYELTGFRSIRRDEVRLTAGFTAKMDIAMGIASVGEEVTVSGVAPVVDVASTSGTTMLTQEVLEITPTARNGVASILTLTPGVRTFIDVGGSEIAENPTATAFGQSGESYYTLDGVAIMEASRAFWDYNTLEEARVQTLGTDAEFPTRGVQLNGVVKSGGNEFHGMGNWNYNSKDLQSDNITPELEAQGIEVGNALESQYDVGGDLGGRIIRNKLWFYTAARYRPQKYSILNTFKPDGSPAFDEIWSKIFTNKVSWQMTTSHRLIGLYVNERTFEDVTASETRAYESREVKYNLHPVTKIEWEGMWGNSIIATANFGHNSHDNNVEFLGGPVGREDVDSERVTGENVVNGELAFRRSYVSRGSMTYYKPNWGQGNHEFKAGYDYADGLDYRALTPKPVNYHLLYEQGEEFQLGIPFQIAFFNAPVFPEWTSDTLGIYLRDQWTVRRRLTLNLGLRYAHETASVPAVCRPAADFPSEVMFPAKCFAEVDAPTFNSFVPRLHASYDLTGDGKTVLKGGWGRFVDLRATSDVLVYDQNSITYGIFAWRDLNGNNDFDLGETDRDPNGEDFDRTTAMEFGTQPPRTVVNPDEDQTTFDEFTIGLEREVTPSVSLRVTGIYSNVNYINRIQNNKRPYESYNVPVTKPDPGPDGIVGNGDDAGTITYYEFPKELQGAAFEELQRITDPRADQHFTSFEVSGVKRLANRWMFTASYSATKKDRPIPANSAFNPNPEINTADTTWDYDFKFTGLYELPWTINLSGNYHLVSGNPFGRTVQLRNPGGTIPSIVVLAEPFGTQRSPDIGLLTFRVEKDFRITPTQRLSVLFNIYNALNKSTPVASGVNPSLQPRSGPNYLRPLAIIPPRVAEFGIAYRF